MKLDHFEVVNGFKLSTINFYPKSLIRGVSSVVGVSKKMI
jgi:hypothetical protein